MAREVLCWDRREGGRPIRVANVGPAPWVTAALRKEGYDVLEAPDGSRLVAHLAQAYVEAHVPDRAVDLIVTDMRMPGSDGLDIVELLRATEWRVPVIVMTAFGDGETRARAHRLGAILLDKPFKLDF